MAAPEIDMAAQKVLWPRRLEAASTARAHKDLSPYRIQGFLAGQLIDQKP
jgi:hypothetical protein